MTNTNLEVRDADKKTPMKLLEGKPVAEEMLSCTRYMTLRNIDFAIVYQEGEASASAYAKQLHKLSKANYINPTLIEVPSNPSIAPLHGFLRDICRRYDKMILLAPFTNFDELNNYLNPEVEIDCQSLDNLGAFFKYGVKGAITPTACMKILDYYKIPLEGKRVAVVGRSNTVGKPLALMCLNRNATVTICHSHTTNLKEVLLNSDIIISAVGKAGLITQDMVNPNAVIIDVGINFVDGKIVGDVDPNVVCKAKTPVPNGVGVVSNAVAISRILNGGLQKQP